MVRAIAAVLAVLLAVSAAALVGPVRSASAVDDTWTARQARVAGAAGLAGGGRGVTVAVLDSWIDSRHPDFQNHVAEGATCEGGACRPGNADVPDSCEAHGTHVAGLVGSRRFGVAPDVQILPVRVLTERNGACQAQAVDVANGIRFAVAEGAQVINISLGSTYALNDAARAIPRAVADADAAGVVVVAAAGNGKTAGADVYGDDALVVAATGPNGQLASYSQRGAGVDLAAPGGQPSNNGCNPDDCVVSTWADRSYAADAGTSMAAPLVAGAAALLLSQRPDRGVQDVVATLTRTAHPLPGAGAGYLDVLAAVRGVPSGDGSGAAPPPDAGAPAGPASASNPSVARVLDPDGTAEGDASDAMARGSGADGQRMLIWTGVALVLLVMVAIVVVARTQRMVPQPAGGGTAVEDDYDDDDLAGVDEFAPYEDDLDDRYDRYDDERFDHERYDHERYDDRDDRYYD